MKAAQKSRIRFVAFGDLHGIFRSERALAQLKLFVRSYEPHVIICGGDLIDFSALRRGATEEDKAMSIDDDVAMGLDVLEQLRPDVYLLGNHENRVYERLASPSAVMREFAGAVVRRINDVASRLKIKVLPYDRRAGVFCLGRLRFVHGFFAGQYAAARHAEVFGDCIFFHIHAFSILTVPRWSESPNPAVAYSAPGMCEDVEYMRKLAGTLRQETGWLYGEINKNSGAYHVAACRESQHFTW